ncbi:hypothetical protein CR513_01007, partial [Mucuna pruriens]
MDVARNESGFQEKRIEVDDKGKLVAVNNQKGILGCDVILGMQWLKEYFGRMLWDCRHLKMEFMKDGKKVKLVSNKKPSIRAPKVYLLFVVSMTTKEVSNPISCRPYRYSQSQKDVIEEMVKESLEFGLVQPSSSPFAFSKYLIKKKDAN